MSSKLKDGFDLMFATKDKKRTRIAKLQELQSLLYLSLSNKTVVTLTNDNLRGIGKTKLLVKVAKEYDLPILVKHDSEKAYIRKFMGDRVEVFTLEEITMSEHEDMRIFDILIDEGFDSKEIMDLSEKYGIHVIGGYINMAYWKIG